MRMQVQALALLGGLRIQPCHELWCGHRWGSDPVLLWLWYRPAAVASIWPLAWELSYATGVAQKGKKKKKKNQNQNQNQTIMRYHFTPTSMAKLRRQTLTNIEDAEKLEPSCIAGGIAKLKNLTSSLAISHNVEHRATIWPSSSISRFVCKRIETVCSHKNFHTNIAYVHTKTCTQIFIALFIATPKWKHQQMKIYIQIYKVHIHTMEYYSAINRTEVPMLVTTWVSLET